MENISLFIPMKAGGSESIHSLGGLLRPPPYIFLAQFFKASSLKKSLTENFNSLGAREG